jgi:hypothetical protein
MLPQRVYLHREILEAKKYFMPLNTKRSIPRNFGGILNIFFVPTVLSSISSQKHSKTTKTKPTKIIATTITKLK